MASRTFPSANSPQLLTRLLEAVARGVRTTRGLQEALGVQSQTARYYIQAGEWLDLLVDEGEVELTPLGLEYVFAGARRSWVYARAVWSNPFAADLLVAGDGRLPEQEIVERAMHRADGDLAEATVRRRASAVRSLIAPVVGRPRPRERQQDELQLGLPLAHAASDHAAPVLSLHGSREYDPDAYRVVLGALLDHGELSLGQVRALLDRAGGEGLPLGGYLDMALRRGDAVRVQERLVVTPQAVGRRELVAATPSLMLSDPRYRAYLDDSVGAQADRAAAVRRDEVAGRYRPWDRRLFGGPLRPAHLESDLEQVLMDRPLATFPVADGAATEPPVVEEPFLDAWSDGPVLVACPPTLAQLQGGVAAVNRLLRQARHLTDVGPPSLGVRPVAVHGGLLHPGEPLPRSVPDQRSLRLRAVMSAPFVAGLVALLLLHRHHPDAVALVEDKAGWGVKLGTAALGDPLAVVDGFGAAHGWIVSRRVEGGLDAATLVRVLEVLGIGVRVGRLLVLEERFFRHLASEPEEQEVADRLWPLADALQGWLQQTREHAA